MDFHQNMPHLQSLEIDYAEFEKDYENRNHTWRILSKLEMLSDMVNNIKVLNDHDNYTDALRDYQFIKYKKEFSSESGFEAKYNAMIVFFPKTGKTKDIKNQL